MSKPDMSDPDYRFSARVADSIDDIDAADWQACAGDDNPFVSHAFLSAMEGSASVGAGTGWHPMPLLVEDADNQLLACAPVYLKSHSQGEYIFDQQWAHAFENAGGRYYPKLQIASPFSPVPGPRLLFRETKFAPALLAAIEQLVENNNLSSAHATFVEPDQLKFFEEKGWLIRQDSQFHWRNKHYENFDAFLAALSSRKRKAVKRERKKAQAEVDIVQLRGDDIRPRHWDAFWLFYQDTGMRKWGSPYLTRSAFDLLHAKMGDQLLLIMAMQDNEPVAGALNIIGGSRLYGRYWGCTRHIEFLHFEICYYQAIDAAISLGLEWVEAGAQGAHKLARGYEAVPTWSAHYIANDSFREAIAEYLSRERQAVTADIEFLGRVGPFKKI